MAIGKAKNAITSVETPEIKEKIDQLNTVSETELTARPDIKSVKDLIVSSAPVKEAFLELMSTAKMPEPMRRLAIYMFGENMTNDQAIKKAFGVPLPKDEVLTAFYNLPATKRAVEMIRAWYITVAPMAAMRETEMLLTKEWGGLDPKDKQKLIQSIHEKAGVVEPDQGGNKVVPVQVNIIVPQNIAYPDVTPQVVLKGEEVEDGK